MDEAENGVVAGTHTRPRENDAAGNAGGSGAAVDLLGKPIVVQAENRAPGSRAGRPNKISRIMAAKVEDEHGKTVLEELVAMAMASPEAIAAEMIALAKATNLDVGVTVRDVWRYKLDCLATAAPYLHAKRAPVDNKGQTFRPIIQIGSGNAGLLDASGEVDDAELVFDAAAIAFGMNEPDQGLSEARSSIEIATDASEADKASDDKGIA
jgi:hypothetical protein